MQWVPPFRFDSITVRAMTVMIWHNVYVSSFSCSELLHADGHIDTTLLMLPFLYIVQRVNTK